MKNLQDEKISVVMSAYNHAPYVGAAIESVLSQTHENIEFLITDDGSSDGTVEEITKFKDPRILFTPSTLNRGACEATNSLIKQASGKYICIMNSDDIWCDPWKLKKQINILLDSPGIGACFGGVNFIDEKGCKIETSNQHFPIANYSKGGWLKRFFDDGNCLCHPTIMIRSKCYEEIGLYNNCFRQLPDYDFWVRLVKKYDIYVSDNIYTNFRVLPGRNASSPITSNVIRDLNEHYIIRKNFFANISDNDFLEGFGDCFEIADLNKANIEIEKSLIYFNRGKSYKLINEIIGLGKIANLFKDEEIKKKLRNEYGIDELWLHKKTGEVATFHHPTISIDEDSKKSIPQLTIGDHAYFLQRELIRSILKPLKKFRIRNIKKTISGARKIIIIYNSGLLRKDFISNRKKNIFRIISQFISNWEKRQGLKKPMPGFHPGIYESIKKLKTEDPFIHYIEHGTPQGEWNFPVITPSDKSGNINHKGSVALQLHVFYPEMAEEIISRLTEANEKPDLLISVTSRKNLDYLSDVINKRYTGNVTIRIVPNKGRDLGPLFTEFAEEIRKYDIIGHFHTKVSPHLSNRGEAMEWYKFLLENIIGGKEAMMDAIISSMNSRPNLGIVFPEDPHVFGWDQNYDEALRLAKKMGINSNLPNQFNFPAGSMFWARTAALLPLFELNLDWRDYPEEPIHHDGTILHAIERVIPFVVKHRGFNIAVSNVPGVSY